MSQQNTPAPLADDETFALSLNAAAQRVETGDPDRFRATMATPADLRVRLWPLYAVNLEIARAPWASEEPLVAEMRLQWWVDALAGLSDRVPDHALGPALATYPQVAQYLMQAAEARRRDCWAEGFADAAEVQVYLRATSGQIYCAAADLLGADATERALLMDFGASAGVASWLLAVPELIQRERPVLPEAALEELARDALIVLRRTQTALRGASRAARLAALPGWQAGGILARAAKMPGRVSEAALEGSEFSRRFSLLWAAFQSQRP
ncbi:MAG TPA: squalene/phytoene synthase family protein [Paenirhodobacter sp.]